MIEEIIVSKTIEDDDDSSLSDKKTRQQGLGFLKNSYDSGPPPIRIVLTRVQCMQGKASIRAGVEGVITTDWFI